MPVHLDLGKPQDHPSLQIDTAGELQGSAGLWLVFSVPLFLMEALLVTAVVKGTGLGIYVPPSDTKGIQLPCFENPLDQLEVPGKWFWVTIVLLDALDASLSLLFRHPPYTLRFGFVCILSAFFGSLPWNIYRSEHSQSQIFKWVAGL